MWKSKTGKVHGNRGRRHTEDAKRRIGESARTRVRTPEHNRRISESNQGKTFSDETKELMGTSWRGKTMPEEMTAKMSVSHRRKSGLTPKGYTGSLKERDRAKHHSKLVRKFGISVDEYETMLKVQHGVCAICGVDSNKSRKHFAVDHDHETGKVRGLLCSCCNAGIGFFHENPEICLKARKYLRRVQ